MANNRVFIGWSGKTNREIAKKVKDHLVASGFPTVIGGEWQASFTVSDDIIHQMNGCDFAIILIEKEERKDKQGNTISLGFNPNVMMELGYLLHKLKDANRIRRILINMDPSELPSDLQGTWSTALDIEERDTSADAKNSGESQVRLARLITNDFFEYIQNGPHAINKLDYFDNWEENVQYIYNYTGDIRIADKLIYGMQAAIYSGDFIRLYKKLSSIKDRLQNCDRFGDYGAVCCALAVLNVFVISRRLTTIPTEEQLDALCNDLEKNFETTIKDEDLKAWCKIFRIDKLELCYELYAEAQSDPDEKICFYYEALEKCHTVLNLINEQIDHIEDEEKRQKTEKYALLYKAFAARNISQIHKHLAELESAKKEEHLAVQKEYCAKTLSFRTELYNYYNSSMRENSLAQDFISQEYLLALTEYRKFEDDPIKRKKMERTGRSIYNKWKERNTIRNMVFDSVTQAGSDFLNPNE